MPNAVPEPHRPSFDAAIHAAFDRGEVRAVHAVGGGVSGALTYRVESSDGDHLLRIETITGPMRNSHQYECMQLAAEAGVAPPIRYVDAEAGVVVMRFITQQPIDQFPGGPPALAAAGGELLARVHDLAPFAPQGDYLDNLDRMLSFLARSGRVAPGLLDSHAEGFARLRAAYPWQPERFVSAHNDPNPFNVLFDGERLWLIDWETAYPNDAMVDAATMARHMATTEELRELLLAKCFGRAPDNVVKAKAALVGWLVQLYAGCILLTVVLDPATPAHTDLTALTPEVYAAHITSGELVRGTPATTHAYAKIMLQAFLDAVESSAFEDAVRTVGGT